MIEEAGQLGTLQADRLLKAVGNARVRHSFGSRGQTSRNSGYTMLSRGIVESHIFASVESHGDIHNLGEDVAAPGRACQRNQDPGRTACPRPVHDLPPTRSDSLVLDDIQLDDIPALDPVRIERDTA